ncbi:hypothetical protein RC1_2849 [Rhodospirillum centenum SW]|uniref:Uncharacterized protein n=1 Tax=Rhodospirillum centenum (strain ATCC 51521 / SW) TaxID=414684 RepID=B6IV97_RHOCS|nr:hypothetical protein RC1_2849 [Rhodospirillum centenum SW]
MIRHCTGFRLRLRHSSAPAPSRATAAIARSIARTAGAAAARPTASTPGAA